MRWRLGSWIALSLTTGCTEFVGASTDGAIGESGMSAEVSTNATATSGTAGATSSSGSSTSATDTGNSVTSTAGQGGDTADASGTTAGSDTTNSESTAAPPSCDNKALDGDETDIDCGGTCSACELDEHCDVGTDCTTGFCTPSSNCALQQPVVWLDALDDATLFSNNECSETPPTDGQQVYCWSNKGSQGGLFVDEGGQPNYRDASDGVEFNHDSMVSENSVFGGALGDVTVFLVQEEVDSQNSYDFNLNHPEQDGGRYSTHIPWGNSDRRIIFDIGGSAGAARIATELDIIDVDETHLFGFVNSAESDQRLIFVDGAEEASENGARSSDAGVVSLGNGNRVILHEFRVYSPSPSGLQRQVIEGQLACRWNLRDALPATHPFYDVDGESSTGCPPSL
ncbi:MAG: hypothetical protein KUG77_16930 [Nannocystaceae bacterium]|nr:hypothetical protein [Nannocystaceae bacterium]